jgi:hypothetical protein
MTKTKKRILITLAIVFLILLGFGLCVYALIQEENYTSKERDEYYENSWKDFKSFEPLDTAFILGFQSEYFEIKESELEYDPYSPDKYSTPYSKFHSQYIDSVFKALTPNDKGYIDDFSYEEEIRRIEEEMGKIGCIAKTLILKYEKKDSIEAFIYESYEYEEFSYSGESPGIWIAYSENNGTDWNYYYTGITQQQPVFVKYYSQRPLIKEKGKLEIDACLLRQLSPFSHPVPMVSYECVKDGIYLVFDMNVISRDSDGDGLTDIVEDKLYLDKFNKDTDGDGIPDNLDMNPRVNYPRTKKSKVYEAILNEDIGNKDMDWAIGRLIFKGNNTIHYFTDSIETVINIPTEEGKKDRIAFMEPTGTVLIITDDKDLMGIQPQKQRIIFVTTEEYKSKAVAYNSGLKGIYISPLFKVDGKKNTYLISCSIGTWSHDYLVQKTIIGWRIRLLSMTIS